MTDEKPKNANNVPPEILAMMPTGKDAPPTYDSVDDGSYRGVPVDPATGRPLDPFRCRDPRNAARTNPRRSEAKLDDDAPWGC